MTRIVLALVLLLCIAPAPGARAIDADDVIGKERMLTLQEAIELALRNNLSLRIARIEPALADLRVDEASGAFDPNLSASSTFEHAETPIASPIQNLASGGAVTATRDDIWTEAVGVAGAVPFGLEYSSQYTFIKTDSTSGFNALRPEFRAAWVTEVTLPLLKDFLRNDARLAVERSRLGRNISDADFATSLLETIQQVENAYWNLTATREQQRVAAKSVDTARNLLDDEKVRYDVGVVSKVNVTQAEAGLAQREFDFIVARNAASAAQDTLLDLLIAPTLRGFGTTTIQTANPTFVEYEIDEAIAARRALEARPEVIAARERVADLELQVSHAWNQRLPSVDLTGSYTLNGLSGTPRPGTTVIGIPEDSHNVNDDFFRAKGERGWSVGVNLSYPLFNQTAVSRLAQRRIELRRVQTQLRQAEQQVVLDVRNAVRGLRDSLDGIRAAERRTTAARETLEAERERLRLGDSTPFQVLEFEEDEAEAATQLIVALQRYRNSITALERAQASLLESRGIRLEAELERGR